MERVPKFIDRHTPDAIKEPIKHATEAVVSGAGALVCLFCTPQLLTPPASCAVLHLQLERSLLHLQLVFFSPCNLLCFTCNLLLPLLRSTSLFFLYYFLGYFGFFFFLY